MKGIIAAKTSKGDVVVKLIAGTFKTLAKAADFSDSSQEEHVVPEENSLENNKANSARSALQTPDQTIRLPASGADFHYNIQIHLPTTTDITVYNAIFKSLKEHLL